MSLTTLNQNSVNKLVLEQFMEGWRSYEPIGTKFFKPYVPERADEKFGIVASDGAINQVSEDADYPEVLEREVGTKTLSTLVFKKSLPCSKKMKAFDNYGVIGKRALKLAYQARHKMDQLRADVLNNGDGSSTVWDGLSLLNASHLIGDSGVTQSNNIGGSLSSANLKEAISRLHTMKDHDGLTMPVMGKYLLVHPSMYKEAFELIGSPDAPDTADRAKNFFNGMGIQVISWPLISVSTTWYLISEATLHQHLVDLMKQAPEIQYIDETKTSNGSSAYRLDFMFQTGAVDYLGVVGNIV